MSETHHVYSIDSPGGVPRAATCVLCGYDGGSGRWIRLVEALASPDREWCAGGREKLVILEVMGS